MNNLNSKIWVFHGSGARFASGVFLSLNKAEDWISNHKLTGVLTGYPIDEGVYDWALKNNYFNIKKASETESAFIQSFTCAGLEHFHFEEGNKET